MNPINCPSVLFYGVPKELPLIPGFTVEASADEFLHARLGDLRFLVEEFETGFYLTPQVEDFNCYHFEHGVWIGKPKCVSCGAPGAHHAFSGWPDKLPDKLYCDHCYYDLIRIG